MVFPQHPCPVCGSPAAGHLEPCQTCAAAMRRFPGELCRLCGSDLAGSDNPCPVCRDFPPEIDGLKACGPWTGVLREWLSSLKYGGDCRLALVLADLLLELWIEEWEGLPVVPVPPRRSRVFRTGSDPVGIMARCMETRGVPVRRVLRRRGGTAQKSLDRAERLQGGALRYRIRRNVKPVNGTVVLLDDVTTTGATLNVCSGLLKEFGAERVFALVVCRD